MTDSDIKSLQSTSLSAEAKSFVPSHLKPDPTDDGGTAISNGHMVAQGLPKYMTNCYPFVQHDVPQGLSVGQNNGGIPHPRGGINSHVPRNNYSPGPGMFNGAPLSPRMPGMQLSPQHMSPRPVMYPGMHPPTATTGHMSQLMPTIHMQCPPPQMYGQQPSAFMSQNYQMAPRGPVSPPNWISPQSPRMPYPHQTQYQPYGPMHGPPGPRHHDPRNKHKKKRGGEWNNMVSVGIQNEAAALNAQAPMHGALPGGSKKKTRPKTIMCMDAAIQTDFSDELANKTLLEKPSSLYQEDRSRAWRRLYQDSTTDSEVDSDSGYSSPMHRRNQASSGTHPFTGSEAYLAHPAVSAGGSYPPLTAMGLPPPPAFSGYAQAVVGYGNMPKLRHSAIQQPPFAGAGSGYHNVAVAPGTNPIIRHSRRDNHFNANAKAFPSNPNSSISKQQPQQNARNNSGSASRKSPPAKPGYSTVVASSPAKHSQFQSKHQATSQSSTSSNAQHSTTSTSSKLAQTSSNHISSSRPSSQSKSKSPTPSRPISRAKTEGEEEDDATSSGSKPKRKRKRNRRKKGSGASPDRQGTLSDGPYDLVRAQSSSNVSRTSTVENEILHFEDEDEFPNLLSAVGGLQAESAGQAASYCDILKSQVSHLSQDSGHSISSGGGFKSSPELSSLKETKNARKKRKRREAIDQAADAELAEISLEQQVLKQLSAKTQAQQNKEKQKTAGGSGKRSAQPISLNIADMISALEKQDSDKIHSKTTVQNFQQRKPRKENAKVANLLDSTAPVKRGKEREVAKPKKPSPLKKVILKEREEKKRLRLLEDGVPVDVTNDMEDQDINDVTDGDSEDEEEGAQPENLSPEGVAKGSSLEINADASADLSPISQTSPISMSPLSGSPLNSGFNSPIANQGAMASNSNSSVMSRIHSRRFREYCTQVLDKDIDNCCTVLLQELVRFQDRLYHKDPNKAKSKRRIVLGLREVTKHLKLKKIKSVVISPNLERIQSKGGLDEALNNIIVIAGEQGVPVVFALGRRALGRACAKLVPVSVAGIFNYEGCEEHFKKLMDMTKAAREAYSDMVSAVEKEIAEQRSNQPVASSHPPTISTIADVPRFFSHMGHSRTPSGCSGISLTSSILSEPISENYPYSEPETDSRGYEIVRGNVAQKHNSAEAMKARDEGSGETLEEKLQKIESDLKEIEEQEALSRNTECASPPSDNGKVCIVESLCEIDEGNEADTEDDVVRKCSDVTASDVTAKKDTAKLPPFDSIHSSSSQKGDGTDLRIDANEHGDGKPLDHHGNDMLSTHSSKTIETGRCSPEQLSRCNPGSLPDLPEDGATTAISNSRKLTKNLDSERIEEWVAKTTKQVELLSMQDQSPHDETEGSDDREVNDITGEGDNDVADDISERLSIHVESSEDEKEEGEEVGQGEASFHNSKAKISADGSNVAL